MPVSDYRRSVRFDRINLLILSTDIKNCLMKIKHITKGIFMSYKLGYLDWLCQPLRKVTSQTKTARQ